MSTDPQLMGGIPIERAAELDQQAMNEERFVSPRNTIDLIERRSLAWPVGLLSLQETQWLLRVARCAFRLDEVINEFLPEYPEAIAEHVQALQDALYAELRLQSKGWTANSAK